MNSVAHYPHAFTEEGRRVLLKALNNYRFWKNSCLASEELKWWLECFKMSWQVNGTLDIELNQYCAKSNTVQCISLAQHNFEWKEYKKS